MRIAVLGLLILVIGGLVDEARTHSQGRRRHTNLRWTEKTVEDVPIDLPVLVDKYHKWIKSDNVAAFTQVSAIKSLTIPIITNLIFVGFDGDGNEGLRITQQDLEPWFEDIDHDLEHLVAPVGDEPLTLDTAPTPPTSIKYSFTTRVVKLSPLITTIIENALLYHARPDDPNFTDASRHAHEADEHAETTKDLFYVDAFKFSSLLNSIVHYLRLSNSYSLFILNPHSPVTRDQMYGYRTGFSKEEMEVLWKHKDFSVESYADAFKRAGDESVKEVVHKDKAEVSYVDAKPEDRNVHWLDLTDKSHEWATAYIRTKVKGEDVPGMAGPAPRQCTEEEDDENCGFDQPTFNRDIVEIAKWIAANGTDYEKRYLYLAQNYEYLHESCLTESWISHGRFGFIDLTAGPFDWGPGVVAEGRKANTTLPRIEMASAGFISSTAEGQDDHEADEHEAITDRRSGEVAEQIEGWVGMTKEGLELQKELYLEMCKDHMDSEECMEFKKKIDATESNIFEYIGEEGEAHMEHVLQDDFLARVGAIVSQTYRHLIARPSPLFNTPFAERISFHFHLVLSHENYEPLHPLNFNMKEFKHELLKLKLPNQEFIFSFKKLVLDKDKTLATAYRSALHTERLPSLSTKGQYTNKMVTYLDSKQIHADLRKYSALTLPKSDEKTPSGRFVRVPIFMFSVDEVDPILIDKYFQAKGLSDMVIIVQSNFGNWKSRMQCNHEPVEWNLRNPLKSALAATALTVYGVIPTHIHYDVANKKASQEWLWSVGDNPLSYTSHDSHFSTFQKDSAFRNQVIVSLQYSVDQINDGVEILSKLKTKSTNMEGNDRLPLEKLLETYNSTREAWNAIIGATERMNWQRATSLLRQAEHDAHEFRRLAAEVADLLDVYKCILDEEAAVKKQKVRFPMHLSLALSATFILAAIALYWFFLHGHGGYKMKIN